MCYACPKPALLSKSSEIFTDVKANTSENSFKMSDILSRNGRVPEVTNCLQVIWSN